MCFVLMHWNSKCCPCRHIPTAPVVNFLPVKLPLEHQDCAVYTICNHWPCFQLSPLGSSSPLTGEAESLSECCFGWTKRRFALSSVYTGSLDLGQGCVPCAQCGHFSLLPCGTAWLCRPALGISLPRDYIAMGHPILWNALIFQNPWHDPIWKATMLRLVQKETSRMVNCREGYCPYLGCPASIQVRTWSLWACLQAAQWLQAHLFSSSLMCSLKWKWKKGKSLSHVWRFVTPWTVAYQAPQPMGFFQARTLVWVAVLSSRGPSWPRDQTQVSHIVGRHFTI